MNFHDGDEDAGALCCVTAVLCLLAHLAVLGCTARRNPAHPRTTPPNPAIPAPFERQT